MGPPTFEVMIFSKEHAFNNRHNVRRPKWDNLTPETRRELYDLKQNKDIVIKAADKGYAVCLLQREDYIAEVMRQLSDTKFYQPVDTNLTEKHREEVQTLITKMYIDGEIEEYMFIYLQDKECRTPHMYFLPKIHKGILPPPGRPIVSANGCPTEKISNIVEHFLNTPSTLNKFHM